MSIYATPSLKCSSVAETCACRIDQSSDPRAWRHAVRSCSIQTSARRFDSEGLRPPIALDPFPRPLRPPLLEQPRQVSDGDYLRPLREDLVHERVLDLRDGVGARVADHDEAIVAIRCVADC